MRLPLLPATWKTAKILAPRAGFEPAHNLINSQVPYQLGYLGTNWWVRAELNRRISGLRDRRFPVLATDPRFLAERTGIEPA
jgi:hypothetical protein